jgi:hypothetical protein
MCASALYKLLQRLYLEIGNGRKSPFEGGRGMLSMHGKLQLRSIFFKIGRNRLPALEKEGPGVVGSGSAGNLVNYLIL